MSSLPSTATPENVESSLASAGSITHRRQGKQKQNYQPRKRKRLDYAAIANGLTSFPQEDHLSLIRRRESLDSYARLQSLINDESDSTAMASGSSALRPLMEMHEAGFDFNDTDLNPSTTHADPPRQISRPSWKEVGLPGQESDSLLPDDADASDLVHDTPDGLSMDSSGEFALDLECESSEDDSEELLGRLQESEKLDMEHEGRKAIAEYMCDETTTNTLQIIGWKIRNHIARESYNDLRETVAEKLDFDSEYKALKLLFNLSNLQATIYECCINSCIAYTGGYGDLDTCPFCQEPRFLDNLKRSPRYKFAYIPLIPRLQAIFADPAYRELCAYRRNHQFTPGSITDCFDGLHYRTLLNKTVEIIHEDGQREVLQHRHFSDDRDVALALFSDGFQLFKKSRVQKTATPLLLVNLNLPPTVRTHLKHLLCLGIIPGPHAPKDINSFFHPAYLELQDLSCGVLTRDIHLDQDFLLHAYVILKGGDLPAIAKFLEEKGHSAFSPCSACEATGIRILAVGNVAKASKIYYFPLRPPADHPVPRGPVWDPACLPMRTDSRIEAQLAEIEAASTATAREALAKKYGLNGRTLLSLLPSISVATSAPRDIMHLLFEHIIPMLISFWKGEYKPWKAKGLDRGQPYIVPQAEWKKIGTLTSESSATIPGSFVRALPNIYKEEHLYIAETYAFWMMYLAPIVLKGRWKDTDKYYRHAVLLSNIIRRLVDYEIPAEDVAPQGTLTLDIIQFVQQYYDYYYQYKNERLPACNSTPHGMLHICEDIRLNGPPWTYWCFAMERFCGSLLPSIKSRSNPYPSLAKRMLEGAQVSQIRCLYPDLKKALERPSRNLQLEAEDAAGQEMTTTHEKLI